MNSKEYTVGEKFEDEGIMIEVVLDMQYSCSACHFGTNNFHCLFPACLNGGIVFKKVGDVKQPSYTEFYDYLKERSFSIEECGEPYQDVLAKVVEEFKQLQLGEIR